MTIAGMEAENRGMTSGNEPKPRLGIYVQVPFCQTKCTYCNFHTGVVSAGTFAPYVDAVSAEIRGWRRLHEKAGIELAAASRGATAHTVYFGGGTPSLLEPRLLVQMMDAIRRTFGREGRTATEGDPYNGASVAGDVEMEVTLEADPETVTLEKAAAWVGAGINRVSLGVQSFGDRELAAAGRMHRPTDVYRAFEILRQVGIGNISFDLIAGLPWQTRESWKKSLEELGKLEPEHVSVYLLEVDEGSRLGKELIQGGERYSAGAVPSDDEMAEFYEMACKVLRVREYEHYEISNWAKPGFASQHNLKYWKRDAYLGFGAGAHSFSGRERWANVHDAAEYVKAIDLGELRVEQRKTVTSEMALEEELFLGLRKLEGIDLARIESEYGVSVRGRFDEFESAGLIERVGDIVRLAEGKLSVSNEVFVGLLR